MSTKTFYLLGDDVSTARQIDVPATIGEDELRQLVASYFAIVDSKGVGFVSNDVALVGTADVLDAEGPIAISVDGKAVREVPGPKGLPYIGNYFEVYPDHLGNHQRLFEMYGPFIKTCNMGSTVYHTNDPALSQIVFSESEFFTKKIIPGHPCTPSRTRSRASFWATPTPRSGA
ncbi:hypothetical protein PG988_011492 [Apiospora saccharicola]